MGGTGGSSQALCMQVTVAGDWCASSTLGADAYMQQPGKGAKEGPTTAGSQQYTPVRRPAAGGPAGPSRTLQYVVPGQTGPAAPRPMAGRRSKKGNGCWSRQDGVPRARVGGACGVAHKQSCPACQGHTLRTPTDACSIPQGMQAQGQGPTTSLLLDWMLMTSLTSSCFCTTCGCCWCCWFTCVVEGCGWVLEGCRCRCWWCCCS